MQVFYGIPFKSGDRILTGTHEYAANYIAFLQVGSISLLYPLQSTPTWALVTHFSPAGLAHKKEIRTAKASVLQQAKACARDLGGAHTPGIQL